MLQGKIVAIENTAIISWGMVDTLDGQKRFEFAVGASADLEVGTQVTFDVRPMAVNLRAAPAVGNDRLRG